MYGAKIGRWLARWTTELVVVFVGVYSAFAVAEWDEEREREERAAQLRAALAVEVRDIQSNTHRVAVGLPLQVAVLDSLMASGRPFRPEPQMEPIGFRAHVWDASLASGALALLDVETFLDASLFYNELNAGFEQIAQLRNLSESMLLPQLDEPLASFFEPDPARPRALRLRQQYAWYRSGMIRLARQARCITVLGDSLLEQMGAPRDTALEALDPDGC